MKNEEMSVHEIIENINSCQSDWEKYWAETLESAEMMERFLYVPGGQSSYAEKFDKGIRGRVCPEMNITKTIQNQILSEFMQAAPEAVLLPSSDKVPTALIITKMGLYRDICYESEATNLHTYCFKKSLDCGYAASRVSIEPESAGSLKMVIRFRKIKNPARAYFDKTATDPNKVTGDFSGYKEEKSIQYCKRMWPKANFGKDKAKKTDTVWIRHHYEKKYKKTTWVWIKNEDGEEISTTLKKYNNLKKLYPGANALGKKAYDDLIARKKANYEDISKIPEWKERTIPKIISRQTSIDWTITYTCTYDNQILEQYSLPEEIKELPIIFWEGFTNTVGDSEIAMPFALDATVPQQGYNQAIGLILDEMGRAMGSRLLAERSTVKNAMDQVARPGNMSVTIFDRPPNSQESIRDSAPILITAPAFDPNLLTMALQMRQEIMGILGRSSENMGEATNAHEFSSILLRKQAGDSASGVYFMNALKAISCECKQALDWMPVTYDTERRIKIRAKNGAPSYVHINRKTDRQDEKSGLLEIENDMNQGEFSVDAIGGPSFAMQKLAGLMFLKNMAMEFPALQQISYDEIFEQAPFEWGNKMSQRVKTAGLMNPEVVAKETGEQPESPPPTVEQKLAALEIIVQALQAKADLASAEAKIQESKIGAVNSLIDSQEKTVEAIGEGVKAYASAPLPQIEDAIRQLEGISEQTTGLIDQVGEMVGAQ